MPRPRQTLALVTSFWLGLAGAAQAADCEGLPGVRCDGGGRTQYSTPAPRMKPVETLGAAVSSNNEPATWGAISFNGDGSRCIGLMRRGACK